MGSVLFGGGVSLTPQRTPSLKKDFPTLGVSFFGSPQIVLCPFWFSFGTTKKYEEPQIELFSCSGGSPLTP